MRSSFCLPPNRLTWQASWSLLGFGLFKWLTGGTSWFSWLLQSDKNVHFTTSVINQGLKVLCAKDADFFA